MLSNSNDTTIHVKKYSKNSKMECDKYLCGISAFKMKEVFTNRIFKYNLRSCRVTLLSNVTSKKYGVNTVVYKAP